eukprot:symbB.v1.2.022373.t1/scaffold1982.1/size93808/5
MLTLRWSLLVLSVFVCAEREVVDSAADSVKSHVLLQRLSTKVGSATIEVQESSRSDPARAGDIADVDDIVPYGIKTSVANVTSSRMMVLAMLLLLSLPCILIDVTGWH